MNNLIYVLDCNKEMTEEDVMIVIIVLPEPQAQVCVHVHVLMSQHA